MISFYKKLKIKIELLKRSINNLERKHERSKTLYYKLKYFINVVLFDSLEFFLILFKKSDADKKKDGESFIVLKHRGLRSRYRHYTAHRSPRQKRRLFISTSFSSFVAFVLIISMLTSIAPINVKYAEAATYNWTQSDWSGGATASDANHASDQTGWTEYSAKDADMTIDGSNNVTLTPLSYYATDDTTLTTDGSATGGGFGAGVNSNTIIDSNSVKLTSVPFHDLSQDFIGNYNTPKNLSTISNHPIYDIIPNIINTLYHFYAKKISQ